MKDWLNRAWKQFLKLDLFLDVQVPFLLLMLLTIMIRLPSLFEPYWYGDESIYLTIGNALRQGLTLYSGIFDHKTPLIYYAAAASGGRIIIWKFFGLFLSLLSLFMFDQIAKILIGKRTWMAKTLVWFTNLGFVLLFNLPLLEGNVVNAEMFFITFGLIGIFLWLKSGVLDDFKLKRGQELQDKNQIKFEKKAASELISEKKHIKNGSKAQAKKNSFWSPIIWDKKNKIQLILSLGAGLFFALSFLTKFHGLFDLYAWTIPLLFLSIGVLKEKRAALMGLIAGFITPLIFVSLFFLIQGNWTDFWKSAFIYSFAYSEFTQLSNNILIEFLFSTKGKILFLLSFTGLLWWQYRRLDISTIFVSLWLISSVVGATLSNRNYPHYFLQIVPALVLIFAVIVKQVWRLWPNIKNKKFTSFIINLIFLLSAILVTNFALKVLKVENITVFAKAKKEVIEYYKNFSKYMIDKQNIYGMYGYYDSSIKDNYSIAEMIKQDPNPHLFTWGNNPNLYAQTGKLPITPYVVNYHLYDFGQKMTTEEPLGLVIRGLLKEKPTYAVIMNEIDGYENELLNQAAILEYLEDYYELVYENNSFSLWRIN